MVIKIKRTLDVIIFFLFISLFDKTFIGQGFHERVGIILFFLFIVHLILNGKILRASLKNFSKLKPIMKVNIALDFILFLAFLWITISGIMAQKTLFSPIIKDASFFKFFHKFMGGVAFIAISIHIALHLRLSSFIKRRRPVALILSIIIALGGVWGVTRTKLFHFLSIPAIVSRTPSEKDRVAIKDGPPLEAADNLTWQHKDGFQKKHRKEGQSLQKGEAIATRVIFFGQYLFMAATIIILLQWVIFFYCEVADRKTKGGGDNK